MKELCGANPANEVPPSPVSIPTLMQGELVPVPHNNFGNPNQSQSFRPQDTVVANEMQGDFGHSSRLSYYLQGTPVYCEQVSSNQPPSEMNGFGNHVWSNPYSNSRHPVSQSI